MAAPLSRLSAGPAALRSWGLNCRLLLCLLLPPLLNSGEAVSPQRLFCCLSPHPLPSSSSPRKPHSRHRQGLVPGGWLSVLAIWDSVTHPPTVTSPRLPPPRVSPGLFQGYQPPAHFWLPPAGTSCPAASWAPLAFLLAGQPLPSAVSKDMFLRTPGTLLPAALGLCTLPSAPGSVLAGRWAPPLETSLRHVLRPRDIGGLHLREEYSTIHLLRPAIQTQCGFLAAASFTSGPSAPSGAVSLPPSSPQGPLQT